MTHTKITHILAPSRDSIVRGESGNYLVVWFEGDKRNEESFPDLATAMARFPAARWVVPEIEHHQDLPTGDRWVEFVALNADSTTNSEEDEEYEIDVEPVTCSVFLTRPVKEDQEAGDGSTYLGLPTDCFREDLFVHAVSDNFPLRAVERHVLIGFLEPDDEEVLVCLAEIDRSSDRVKRTPTHRIVAVAAHLTPLETTLSQRGLDTHQPGWREVVSYLSIIGPTRAEQQRLDPIDAIIDGQPARLTFMKVNIG